MSFVVLSFAQGTCLFVGSFACLAGYGARLMLMLEELVERPCPVLGAGRPKSKGTRGWPSLARAGSGYRVFKADIHPFQVTTAQFPLRIPFLPSSSSLHPHADLYTKLLIKSNPSPSLPISFTISSVRRQHFQFSSGRNSAETWFNVPALWRPNVWMATNI